jgi:hypothetical protein
MGLIVKTKRTELVRWRMQSAGGAAGVGCQGWEGTLESARGNNGAFVSHESGRITKRMHRGGWCGIRRGGVALIDDRTAIIVHGHDWVLGHKHGHLISTVPGQNMHMNMR